MVFHTLAFTRIPVWATSGPWLSAPIGRFPRKKGDVLVPSAGGGVGNQHDTTQLARELHKGIRIWKRRWCNGISEQVDRTGKSVRPLDIWQLKTIGPNQDLAVGHHSSPSTQQQHLWVTATPRKIQERNILLTSYCFNFPSASRWGLQTGHPHFRSPFPLPPALHFTDAALLEAREFLSAIAASHPAAESRRASSHPVQKTARCDGQKRLVQIGGPSFC